MNCTKWLMIAYRILITAADNAFLTDPNRQKTNLQYKSIHTTTITKAHCAVATLVSLPERLRWH
jgi:hypothetical protein